MSGLVLTDYGPPVSSCWRRFSRRTGPDQYPAFRRSTAQGSWCFVVKRIFGARGVSAVEAGGRMSRMACLLTFIARISYFDIIRGGAP